MAAVALRKAPAVPSVAWSWTVISLTFFMITGNSRATVAKWPVAFSMSDCGCVVTVSPGCSTEAAGVPAVMYTTGAPMKDPPAWIWATASR